MREGWKKMKFGDAVLFPPKISLKRGNDHPFIPMEDIKIGVKYVKSSSIKILNGGGAKFESGDTLFARITPSLENGKIAQVKGLTSPGFGSTEYFVFRGIDGISDSDFIFYLVNTHHFKQNAINSMVGASGRQRVDAGFVKKLQISLPPLPIQRKIASILSAYDDLIENNIKRIKLLEEKAQLTYEQWFVRMKFPGHETAVIDEETGLPEGWEEKTLVEVAEINSDSIKKNFSGDIHYIDIASVSPGKIEQTTTYNIVDAPGRAKRVLKQGDVIWSCVRPNRKSHAVIWNPIENLIASTGFCVISPNILPTSYVLQYTTTDEFVGYLTNRAGGAAYPAVKAIDFKEAQIIVPIKDLLIKFENALGDYLEISWNLEVQNQLLKEARDILLPRLMMGMIEV